MADFNPNDQELTTPFEEEIADFLQADLNLRPVEWANSSTELLNDGENIVEETICESVVEEIILEQENENYLTGLEGNCMENSIVYLFEDPVADYSLGEPEFVIEESLTYDLEEPLEGAEMNEVGGGDTMDSNSSQETSQTEENMNENEYENVVQQETLVENSVNNFVNSSSDSDSVKSTSLRENIVDSELKNDSENVPKLIGPLPYGEADPESSESCEMKDDFEYKLVEFQSPKPNRFLKKFDSPPISISSLKTTTKSSSSSLLKEMSVRSVKTDVENSPSTPGGSAKASVLGKEQIKKRLQSFSLMKQGIQPIPIKKIINKSPKIQVQLQSDTYDELGNKIDEKLVIIKKPPKQGPTPQERARAVIDEIEQIKREEQLIYEENLSFISNSMREAIKKSKKPTTSDEIDCKYFEKDKPFERKPRKYRDRRSLDKDKDKDKDKEKDKEKDKDKDKEKGERKRNKSREVSSEKSRDSFKEEEKKVKEDEVPRTWNDVKLRNMSFEQICILKEKMFKSVEKNFKKGLKRFEEKEKIFPFRKTDYIKPQIMFEDISLIRSPLPALGLNGQTKYYASEDIKFTEKLPVISYCENPNFSINLNKPRKVLMTENPPRRNEFMMKIIEGKTEKLNADSIECSTIKNWYPKRDYLIESKPIIKSTVKPIINTEVKTNALLVLSEMYDDEDDSDKDKHKKQRSKSDEKSKSKSKKKKLKKKKRKLKSKSRSQSRDKKHKSRSANKIEKPSKCEEIIPLKSAESSKKITKDKDKTNKLDDKKVNAIIIDESKCKADNSGKKDDKCVVPEKEKEKEKEKGGEEDTPNTDEYRSNWESDLEMDIISENPFSKNSRDNCLDQNWEIDEERRDHFQNRNRSRTRRSRSVSLERINRKQQDVKRHYKSSFLIDLELEEKKKRSNEESNKRSNRTSTDERNVPFERDRKSSRTRNDSTEKHQNIGDTKKTSEENKKIEEKRKSKDVEEHEHRPHTKNDTTEIVKETKNKSRYSEEKSSSSSHRSERTQTKDHKIEHKSHKSSHEPDKKISESTKNEDSKLKESKNVVEKSKNVIPPEIEPEKVSQIKECYDEHQVKPKILKINEEAIDDDKNKNKNKNEKFKERNDSLSKSKCYRSQHSETIIQEQNIIDDDDDDDEETKEKKSDKNKRMNSELNTSVDVDDKSRLLSSSSNIYNKWSSEEDLHNKRKPSGENEIKLNLNYNRRSQWSDDEDYERKRNVCDNLNEVRSKYRWEDDIETQCRNLEAEIQKKKQDLLHLKNIEEYNKINFKHRMVEPKIFKKKENETKRESSEERYKNREKKAKKKIKDKNKPKITLNYSDYEDSIEAEFTKKVEIKQQPKESTLFDANEIFTKYKAKIKIDYTDFDLSLNECKEKFEESVHKNIITDQSINISSSPISVKKPNFDFSEILNESNNEIQNQLKKNPPPPSPSPSPSQEKIQEIEIEKVIEPVQQIKDIPIPLISTINVNLVSDISPVVPPPPPPVTPISKVHIETSISTPDPNKLVSEYEEFMKAVCFEDSKEEASISTQQLPDKKTLDTVTKNIETDQIKEKKADEDDDDSDDNDSSDSSEDITDSDSDDSSDDDSSASELSEMSETTVLQTVANIKTEVLSDSDNEHLSTRKDKRKRNDLSECEADFTKVVVKNENDGITHNKKARMSNTDFDKNLIEWETSLTSKNMSCDKMFNPVHQSEIDVFDIAPSTVLPENIPLPQDNTMQMQFSTTPLLHSNEFQYNQSPKRESYAIINSECTPSPVKRSQLFIPIKLLTADTRKVASVSDEWKSEPEHYDLIPQNYYNQEEKSLSQIVSSSDTSNAESAIAVLNTVSEIQEESPTTMRKRQSHWNLNLIPTKKPLLLNPALGFNQEDSDEDFTEKLAKSPEKKVDKALPSPAVVDKLKTSNEIEVIDSKITKEPIKTKDKEKSPDLLDKTKVTSESNEKEKVEVVNKSNKDKNRRSSSEKDKKDKKESDKNRDRPREKSCEKSSDKSVKDRQEHKEHQRDRDKRRSDRSDPKQDRRSSSDRKFAHSKSNRSRYSRDRSPIRSRSSGQDRSRERSKDRGGRNDRRDSRDFRDKRDFDRSRANYRRDKYSRSPTPPPSNRSNCKQDYRLMKHPSGGGGQTRPDDTDFSMHSMDLVHSPINSPLDGFKRSLADSTISDSELLSQQITPDESEQSPGYSQMPKRVYYNQPKELPIQRLESPSSPKRISLDDRINLVLGIEKEPPKSIDTVCSRGPFTNTVPNYQHHDPYGYARHDYEVYNAQTAEHYPPPGAYHHHHHQYPQTTYYQNPVNTENNVKVVQVGNVIQVVPNDHQPIASSASAVAPTPTSTPMPMPMPTPIPAPAPVSVAKSIDMPPKVLQVGNMLQIVPMTIMDTTTDTTRTSPLAVAVAVAAPSTPIPDPVAAPKPIDQLVLERRAEKEKRRVEREQRRLEKEKKRKEKEKRRQLKIKLKTENMIKKALLLETGEAELEVDNVETEIISEASDLPLPIAWPPSTSTILSLPLPKPPGKGILISQGFREKDESMEECEIRKVVKFADGICPGEGTSPSGGEELPSPPPPPRKLPKEKRYKKVKLNKVKNKKKVKVKIIRTQQPPPSDSSDTEDNLPPPPPPPGSPPPHLWPPRIKQPPVNNIHPQLNIPVSNPPIYPPPGPAYVPSPQMAYSAGGYPPSVVMPLLQASPRTHHPPVIPVLQPGVPSSHHGHGTHHGPPSYH